jgi:hypothetical protein
MMPHEAITPHSTDSEGFERRLAAYSRYAAIVQAQFRALQEEDVERFSELVDRRQEIQEGIQAQGGEELSGAGVLDEERRGLLKGARDELAEVALLDQEIKRRLVLLRGKAASDIKMTNRREGSVKEYLNREERASLERPSRLNVRL